MRSILGHCPRMEEIYSENLFEDESQKNVFQNVLQIWKSEYYDCDIELYYTSNEIYEKLSPSGTFSIKSFVTTREIMKVISGTIQILLKKAKPDSIHYYEEFLKNINKGDIKGAVIGDAIITTNWDIILESLNNVLEDGWVNYECSDGTKYVEAYDRKGEQTAVYNIFKIHGSLNWGFCKYCKKIYYFTKETYTKLTSEEGVRCKNHGTHLFSWDDVLGGRNDERLKESLNRYFSIDWVKKANIIKIEEIDNIGARINDTMILLTDEKNSLLLKLNDEKRKLILKFDDGGTEEFDALMENGRLNIYPTKLEPFIVPPTFLKSDRMETIWLSAFDCLRSCEKIYFIGYSFPETDAQTKVLVSSALRKNTVLREIIVVSKDLFIWNEIPGNDNGKLIDFLKQDLDIAWIRKPNIEKIDNDETIKVSDEQNSLLLRLNEEGTKVELKIGEDAYASNLLVKEEDGNLYVYDENFKKRYISAIPEKHRSKIRFFFKGFKAFCEEDLK